jgi:uncharacterized tellurite resistance protein B-like protein
MIWLSSSTLARLRDQLLERGAPPSMLPPTSDQDDAYLNVLERDIGPLCEAMFLMMSSDGDVASAECEVLRGAVRNLSHDSVRTVQIDALLERARLRVEKEGLARRLESVAAELKEDTARSEVAFVLAAAIAFADNLIADEENDTLNRLAELLEIDDARANALLDQLDEDMKQHPDRV